MDVAHIPRGAKNLVIWANAPHSDLDIYVYDPAADKYVVHWDKGVIKTRETASYSGMSLHFSGDDREPPVKERVRFHGSTTIPLVLKVNNYADHTAQVSVGYQYDDLVPCPDIPDGCERNIEYKELNSCPSGYVQVEG